MKAKLIIGILILILVACGDSDFVNSTTYIRDLFLEPSSIAIGNTANLKVELEPGQDVSYGFGDQDPVYTSFEFALNLILPKGIEYVQDSAKLSESLLGDVIFGGPDPKSPARSGTCVNRKKYLVFNFKRGELGDGTQINLNTIYLKLGLRNVSLNQHEKLGAFIQNQVNQETGIELCDESFDQELIIRTE
jgi:hypothetical protein